MNLRSLVEKLRPYAAPLALTLLLSAAVLGARACAPSPSVGLAQTAEREVTAHVVATEATHAVEQRATVRTVRRVESRPDGTRVETTAETHTAATLDAASVATTDATSHAAERVTTVIVRTATPRWRLGLGAVWQLDQLRPSALALDPALALRPRGAQVEAGARIVGPLWLTATVRTDRTAALTMSAEW